MFDLKAHLKTLTETHAPSGHEGPVRDILRTTWQPWVDAFEQDGLGSLIGIKRANRPTQAAPARRIMLAAHMDEIALMVRDIVDGFLFVQRVTGLDNRVMPAQPVRVHGKRVLPGVVATKPPHLTSDEEQKQYLGYDALIVDLGLPHAEVVDLVQIGDLITPDAPLIDLLNGRVAAKALDDRASVAAVSACLHALQHMTHSWDVYAAATVQEEGGLKGATTAAYKIKPDAAIALDVGFAKQPGSDQSYELGGGLLLGVGPNFHVKLNAKLRETAKAHEIKLHDEPTPGRSGTDAWAIQVAQEGVPTALFSLPIRNMHSPVETIALRDIERAGRLLAHFIASLDDDFLASIDYDRYPRTEADPS